MAEKERQKESCDTREITSLLLKSQFLAGCFRFAHASSPRVETVSGYFPPPFPVIRSWSVSPRGESYRCPKIVRITRGSELLGSGSPREHSDEEVLGYRMRDTTNWSKLTNNLTRVNPKCKLGAFRLNSPSRLQAINLECINTMWHRVVLVVDTTFAETYTASIFTLTSKKVAQLLVSVPNYTMTLSGLPEYEYSFWKTSEDLHINFTSVCLSY